MILQRSLIVILLASSCSFFVSNCYAETVDKNKTSLAKAQRWFMFKQIKKRLSLMKQVAAYKHVKNLPTENKKIEQRVLSEARKQSREYGIDSNSIQGFIEAQITAAKVIQDGYRATWQNGEGPQKVGVSLEVLRSDIQAASESVTSLIYGHLRASGRLTNTHWREFNHIMDKEPKVHHLTEKAKASIFKALVLVKLDPSAPKDLSMSGYRRSPRNSWRAP